ncbi:uncharacterized protein LOC100371780 [Saccoglossus kowalevskii]|uniref:Uncharacterized protein LOC100371780 n=1 Tax=Saccoglossus kowalevskii TaxID=10224 RepID=A0ABM0MJT4_SACKO|nr:PREDICTED: uncharacterized protein LOC100371780 [Saccoglossus kowalevskii]
MASLYNENGILTEDSVEQITDNVELHANTGNHWDELLKDIEDLSPAQMMEVQEEIERLECKYKNLNAKMDSLKGKADCVKAVLNRVEQNVGEVKDRVVDMENEVGVVMQQIDCVEYLVENVAVNGPLVGVKRMVGCS